MPYSVDRKNKCVYKKNADGSRGKKVGCTNGALKDYLAALYVHEGSFHTSNSSLGKMTERYIRNIVKKTIQEMKENSSEVKTPRFLKKFFREFPLDATKWSQATDQVGDLCKIVRDAAELDDVKLPPSNLRQQDTPAKWNKTGHDYVVSAYNKLSAYAKKYFETECKENFRRLF